MQPSVRTPTPRPARPSEDATAGEPPARSTLARLLRSRRFRIAVQLAVSGAVIAYLVWQIDIGETADHIASSNPAYVVAAVAIFAATLWPQAWRWQVLLASKGIHEPLGWLTKLYFIGYAASQVLPTSVGGDAVRILEHARRRPKAKGEAAGAVLMERVVGSAGTLILVALGLVLAIGRYDNIGLVVQVEFAAIAATVLVAALVFSRRTHDFLQEHVFPRGAAVKLHRPLKSLWSALHGYRSEPRALGLALGATVVLQFVRTLAIWMCGEAVGLNLSPLVYVIFGPLLFLIMMIPITVNGLGVRESFFVFFLGRFGVDPAHAFAAGFLFFTVTVATALPGGFILALRSIRATGVSSVSRSERARA
jgi:glycosyltransferase 2 family protein